MQIFQIALIKEWKNGILEGISRSKLEIAKKMLQEGLDISTIENITGISEDEILKLHEN